MNEEARQKLIRGWEAGIPAESAGLAHFVWRKEQEEKGSNAPLPPLEPKK